MQQPPVLQKGFAPYRSRNATNSSRLERFEANDNRWPYHPPENFTNTNPVLSRGGYQRGGRKSAGRRGGYNQRNATAPVTQFHYGSDFAQKQRDGGSWRNKGRREGSDPVQVVCQNVQDDYTIKDYVHCSCQMCEARNRSMHVVAEAQQDLSVAEMQSRIKSGLSEIYGFVDGVFPLASKEPGRFMVRFRRPSSVGAALTIGGGKMPEQDLSLIFSPAMRSKWTLSEKAPTRVASGQSTGQHPSSLPFSPYPFGLMMSGNAQSAATTRHTPPGMLHPSVANPESAQNWDKGGVQHEFATTSQPYVVDRSSSLHQSTTNMTHFLPRVHCLPQNQPIVVNDTHHYNVSTAPIEPLQTKPPAEEALGDIDDQDRRDRDSPRSDGSKTAAAKPRVSLPNTPTKASIGLEEPPAAHLETIEKGIENQTGAEIESRPQLSEPPPVKATHTRASSVFTEIEIKERRQAWAKIPMPLNPQRPKNLKSTNANSRTVKNDGNSGASEDHRREAYAIGSEMSTPTQTVTFTPEFGSVYGQSPDEPVSPRPAQKDPPLTQSTRSVGQETATLKNDDRDEPLSSKTDTTYYLVDGAAQRHPPNQMKLSMPVEKDAPLSDIHATNQQTEHAQGTQTKGKGKGSKSKSKSKSKKSLKQKTITQGNESSSHIPQSDSFSPALSIHTAAETYQNASMPAHLGSLFKQVSENESFDVSPTKRHHEEPEQQHSASGSFKRTKKQGDDPEAILQSQLPPLDEFDSPDEDARGRKGFRVGKGGSLRMGKTRRPRPVTIGSALAEQSKGVAMSPPSSDFAFQNQNATVYAGSSSLHGPDNSATRRLNPKAQEFVSPSRVTLFNAQVPVVFSEDEVFKRPALDDATNRIRKAGQIDQEPLKPEIGSVDASPTDDSMPSTTATSTSKHRRALSEAARKENHTSDKQAVCHTQVKMPRKGSKRAKGKERAATLSAKTERNEGEKETTQNSPRTPKQHNKTKKPGLINDDWPSLPVSRDRALSKPQTTPVWATKTKTAEENGDEDESPPLPNDERQQSVVSRRMREFEEK